MNKKKKTGNKTGNSPKENKGEKKKIPIPRVKELSLNEIVQIYKDELKRKDEIIQKLENENKLLLDLTMRNTKKRLEELNDKTNSQKK